MKFLHLADLHLGRSLHEISLIDDQKYILDQILDMVTESGAEAVILAGDVYDRSVPSEEAVSVLDEFLARLSAMKVSVLMISGNHDSDVRLDYGSRLFRESGIYVAGSYRGKIEKVTLQDEYGPVNFYLLPFVKSSLVRHYFPDETIENYGDAVRIALEHTAIDPSGRNVLIAHQFVTADGDPILSGSEKGALVSVGTIEKVPAALFDAFDYVALGHIHRPQRVLRETVRYAGSPLCYSISEMGQRKTVPLVEMGRKTDEAPVRDSVSGDGEYVRIDYLPVRPKHEVREIKGKLADLIRLGRDEAADDYLSVILTDEQPVMDAMYTLREFYPNILQLRYEVRSAADDFELSAVVGKQDFRELMNEFFTKINGRELTEEEWELLRETAGEAGVIHEAD